MVKKLNKKTAWIGAFLVLLFLTILSFALVIINGNPEKGLKKFLVYEIYRKHILRNFSSSYKNEKAVVAAYFDEKFYRKKYDKQLKLSGLKPLDHFMVYGAGSPKWKEHYDPNSWFNVTLYKYRLWPCSGNPFVDFLRQPTNVPPLDAGTIRIYTKKSELKRAWYAVEAFLRKQQHHVALWLNKNSFTSTPEAFKAHEKRGLKVIFYEGIEKSFYDNDFFKNPPHFIEHEEDKKQKPYSKAMVLKEGTCGHSYVVHYLYEPTGWDRIGTINPCAINVAHYCNEPVSSFLPGGGTEEDFKSYMERISDAFDLVLVGVPVSVENAKIIPGYMGGHEEKMPAQKDFSVSFLLSMGGHTIEKAKSFKHHIYANRLFLWERMKEIQISKKFYVSTRDIGIFSEKYKEFTMPTASKEWIFKSQFSIAIENTRQVNYFTEKLLGCFYTLTVPIYIGCPNITDYFNPKGMIIVKDVDEAIAVCNSITPKSYAKMLPFLKENRQKAIEFFGLEEKHIQDFFKEKFGCHHNFQRQ